jgi:hypothetical protein
MKMNARFTDNGYVNNMTEQPYIREAAIRQELPAAGALKLSAYNRTRERFLCGEIEAGDYSSTGLEARLRTLAPGSSAGVWMAPFRGISATSVRVPVDLVYLDRNCVVIDTVESFPMASVPSSSRPADSVLALPANTIASAGTQRGDLLILCAPEEMKRHLMHPFSVSTAAKVGTAAKTGVVVQTAAADVPAENPAPRAKAGRVLEWVDRSRSKPAAENSPVEVAPVVAPSMPEPEREPAPVPQVSEPAAKAAKPAKGWLQRLLNPGPPEPRKAQRECLDGLAAYFFTGGNPAPHAVRDISRTGLYVLTEERWYPGTVVRMTLTDRRQQGAELSMMVYASVVRWGNDGVGLQFVLADEKNQRGNSSTGGPVGGANRAQVDGFIARMKSASR